MDFILRVRRQRMRPPSSSENCWISTPCVATSNATIHLLDVAKADPCETTGQKSCAKASPSVLSSIINHESPIISVVNVRTRTETTYESYATNSTQDFDCARSYRLAMPLLFILFALFGWLAIYIGGAWAGRATSRSFFYIRLLCRLIKFIWVCLNLYPYFILNLLYFIVLLV